MESGGWFIFSFTLRPSFFRYASFVTLGEIIPYLCTRVKYSSPRIILQISKLPRTYFFFFFLFKNNSIKISKCKVFVAKYSRRKEKGNIFRNYFGSCRWLSSSILWRRHFGRYKNEKIRLNETLKHIRWLVTITPLISVIIILRFRPLSPSIGH